MVAATPSFPFFQLPHLEDLNNLREMYMPGTGYSQVSGGTNPSYRFAIVPIYTWSVKDSFGQNPILLRVFLRFRISS